MLASLVDEFELKITVKLVKSELKKADVLTRIRKKWQVAEKEVGCIALEEMKKLQDAHHMGVERSWYLAKEVELSIKQVA